MSKIDTELKDKINEILQEIRIILPGTEALLGFQFVTFFNPVFQNLSSDLQYLHLGTLVLTMVCTILLIAPVAFQQIGEAGQATNSFLQFARQMINIAMAFLLLALAGNAFLAARTIDISQLLAIILAAAVFITGAFFWYVYMLLRRNGKS